MRPFAAFAATGRALVRLPLLLGWILLAIVLQSPLQYLPGRARLWLPRRFHAGICALLGIRLTVRGAPARARPVLWVANHQSYLDIPVLGALLEGCFVSKAEVAHWPLFGFLARLQDTVFIERRSRHAAGHRTVLQDRLLAGDNMIVFPEGTSTDGRILPFKSTLFALAAALPDLWVQPVSLRLTHLAGLPVGRALHPAYCWYGDMTLPAHLWRVLGLPGLSLTVTFHPPLRAGDFADRKALAAAAEAMVRAGCQQRLPAPGLPPAYYLHPTRQIS